MSTPTPASTPTPTPPSAPTVGRRSGAGHPGPPLYAAAGLFAIVFVLSVAIGPLTGAGSVPSPFGSTAQVAGWFADHGTVAGVTAWLVVFAATPLALFTAIARSRLAFLAPNAPGPAIAAVGGVLTSGLLALSGLVMWAESRPAVAGDARLVHALHYVSFAAGGPAHNAAFGLLVGGIAVTSIFIARTPRWLAVVGIALAAIDLLGILVLVAEPLAPVLPVGRFGSIVWLVVISVLLPRERAARGRR